MRTKYIIFLFLTSISFTLNGCAINMHLPINRFESPEANGELGSGRVEPVAVGGETLMSAVPVTTATPPDTTTQGLSRMLNYSVHAGVGLFDRLDAQLKIPTFGIPMIQAKFQFLGDPRSEAEEGNFSAAVTAAGGVWSQTGTDKESDIFWHSPTEAKYDVDSSAFDLGLIFGYRFDKRWMFYGGPFFSQLYYEGKLDQAQVSGPIGHYQLKGKFRQVGGNFGFQVYLKRVHFAFEVAYSHAYNGVGGQLESLFPGFAFGIHW